MDISRRTRGFPALQRPPRSKCHIKLRLKTEFTWGISFEQVFGQVYDTNISVSLITDKTVDIAWTCSVPHWPTITGGE